MYETQKQYLDMTGLALSGRILDIGGGGEAIITRCFGGRVVAIDNRPDELEETPDIGLKLVMDACHLQFLDRYFDHITCFFSLMYMPCSEVVAFLAEAHRVLKQGGRLWIWDVVMPAPQDDIFVVQLSIKLSPSQAISTGYGVKWERQQNLDSVTQPCQEAGFTTYKVLTDGQVFGVCFDNKHPTR